MGVVVWLLAGRTGLWAEHAAPLRLAGIGGTGRRCLSASTAAAIVVIATADRDQAGRSRGRRCRCERPPPTDARPPDLTPVFPFRHRSPPPDKIPNMVGCALVRANQSVELGGILRHHQVP